MRKLFVVCLTLITVAAVYGSQPEVRGYRPAHGSGSAGNELYTQTDWIKFNSPEGRFSVLLPHEPKFESVAATETSGITNYRYSDIESGYGFICEYFDVPSAGDDVQSFLDTTRDGILKGAGATKVSEEKISLNSYPGRELQMSFTLKEGTEIIARTRIYLVDKRLYSITLMHVKSMDAALVADYAKKFFASFEVKGK